MSSQLAQRGLPRYKRILCRLLYRHADLVVYQSRAMAEDLADELDLSPEEIAVLPNPVDLIAIQETIRTGN